MSRFSLHPRLQADTLPLAELPLCSLLLMNDTRYPWFILVPRHPDVQEIYQLSETDQQVLISESCQLGQAAMAIFAGDKLNVAALGNLVPQLHLHHVVRYRDDDAWPGPVWGKGSARPYKKGEAETFAAPLLAAMGL